MQQLMSRECARITEHLHTLNIVTLFAVVLSLFSGSAFAEDFQVTNGNESGPGSLRHAVELANDNGNPSVVDRIIFAPKVTLVLQDDLDVLTLTGPIHITQSVAIVGPGSATLTIDGQFQWMNGAGRLNTGFPDSPTSTILTRSGNLFEVGISGQDNSAIYFSLSGTTVTGTNGLVKAWEKAEVSLFGLSVRGNATTSIGLGFGALIASAGSLQMIECDLIENTIGEHSLIQSDDTVMRDCVVDFNRFGGSDNGLRFGGQTLEIDSCDIGVGGGQIVSVAKHNYIANSLLKKSTPGFYAALSLFYDVYLRNVTVLNSRIINSASNPIGDPSHLQHAFGMLDIANTVFADLSPPDPSFTYEPFVAMQDTTIALNTHNHVDDGSLAGAATGPALLDSHARPMTGSPLIDAGLDSEAKNPSPGGAPLQFDLNGLNRISGTHVDIGAIEAQQNFAIDDAYTVDENSALGVSAPGVLANDTFDLPGTLKNNSIIIAKNPDHGQLDADNLAGGFIYFPDTDFHGIDTFEYLAQFTDPIGLTHVATVTITVLHADVAPVANPDAYETVEGQTLVVNAPGVLGNDTDSDNLAPTPPNAGLTLQNVTQPGQGSVTAAPDGSFEYVPGAPGTYVWTYETVDPQGTASLAPGQVTITVHPTGTVLGHEGLSHGYWKQHLDTWHGTVDYLGDQNGNQILKSILPTQSVAYHFSAATVYNLGGLTMEDALHAHGGRGPQAAAGLLLKQAVAALLNAAHPNINYPLTIDAVIESVNMALTSDDRDTMLDLADILYDYNNLGDGGG